MSKHLVDIDERALHAARRRLGTKTIKATVNQALRAVSRDDAERRVQALKRLAAADLLDREQAWR